MLSPTWHQQVYLPRAAGSSAANVSTMPSSPRICCSSHSMHAGLDPGRPAQSMTAASRASDQLMPPAFCAHAPSWVVFLCTVWFVRFGSRHHPLPEAAWAEPSQSAQPAQPCIHDDSQPAGSCAVHPQHPQAHMLHLPAGTRAAPRWTDGWRVVPAARPTPRRPFLQPRCRRHRRRPQRTPRLEPPLPPRSERRRGRQRRRRIA
jgi:hypothetical protein